MLERRPRDATPRIHELLLTLVDAIGALIVQRGLFKRSATIFNAVVFGNGFFETMRVSSARGLLMIDPRSNLT